MNYDKSRGFKKPFNVFVVEHDKEIQDIYRQFFKSVASQASFTIFDSFNNIDI